MEGTEIITISFKNASSLRDIAGNILTENYYAQGIANPFIYISDTEKAITEGAGQKI